MAEEEWWADAESRVLADLVDPDPEPIPLEEQRRVGGRPGRGSGGCASTTSGSDEYAEMERRVLTGGTALRPATGHRPLRRTGTGPAASAGADEAAAIPGRRRVVGGGRPGGR